jgi:hypothetical protein
MYIHSEDMPLHRSRANTAAGEWLTATQEAAENQNRTTSFLKPILEEVVVIRG